jgi:hypothetical protein
MKSRLHVTALIALSLALTACIGIPLKSIPKLYSLQSQLLDSNPGEFMLAVQIDAKMVPPVGSAPTLHIKIAPEKPGAYEPIDKEMLLRVVSKEPSQYRLPVPNASRRWLIYALPPEAQTDLVQVQAMFRKLRAQKQAGDNSKSTLSMGIAYDALAVNAPQFANTRFETWLQAIAKEGFFELWSGTVSQVFEDAKKKG